MTDEYYAERCNGGHYAVLPPLMGGTPSTADVERVHDRKKALYSDFLDVVRPNTALMEILRTMQAAGHDLACVTTGSKQNATEVLEHFGVRELFGLIVTGEDVEKQKPDPEGYCKAMAHFRVTPAETMILRILALGWKQPRPAERPYLGWSSSKKQHCRGRVCRPARGRQEGGCGKARQSPLRLRSVPPWEGRAFGASRMPPTKKQPLRNLSSRAVGLIWGNYLFSGRTISRMTLTMFSAERP